MQFLIKRIKNIVEIISNNVFNRLLSKDRRKSSLCVVTTQDENIVNENLNFMT